MIDTFREYFNYNPVTGELRWRVSPATNVSAGYIAGRRHTNGHLEVGLKRRVYMAHHIAWVLYYGKAPDTTLVHINGNKADNRIENLQPTGRLAKPRRKP